MVENLAHTTADCFVIGMLMLTHPSSKANQARASITPRSFQKEMIAAAPPWTDQVRSISTSWSSSSGSEHRIKRLGRLISWISRKLPRSSTESCDMVPKSKGFFSHMTPLKPNSRFMKWNFGWKYQLPACFSYTVWLLRLRLMDCWLLTTSCYKH